MYFKFLYLGFKIYCFLFRPIRMGVRVVMMENESVWLIRHTYLGGWYLPGGGLNKWESLDQAARREAREETGAELGEISLLGYSPVTSNGRQIIQLYSCAEISSLQATQTLRSQR